MKELVVTDPATGDVVGRLPCSQPGPLVAAARRSHPGWGRTSPGARAAALKAGAARLRAAVDEVALLQTQEGGKVLADSGGAWRPGSRPLSSTPSSGRCTGAAPCRGLGTLPT